MRREVKVSLGVDAAGGLAELDSGVFEGGWGEEGSEEESAGKEGSEEESSGEEGFLRRSTRVARRSFASLGAPVA